MTKNKKMLIFIIGTVIGFVATVISISIYENWMHNSIDPIYGIVAWLEFQDYYWARFWILVICNSLSMFSLGRDYYGRKNAGAQHQQNDVKEEETK